jgi:hypothetical protein
VDPLSRDNLQRSATSRYDPGVDLNDASGSVAAEHSALGALENIDARNGVQLKNRCVARQNVNLTGET